jgi:hypothetical protein
MVELSEVPEKDGYQRPYEYERSIPKLAGILLAMTIIVVPLSFPFIDPILGEKQVGERRV